MGNVKNKKTLRATYEHDRPRADDVTLDRAVLSAVSVYTYMPTVAIQDYVDPAYLAEDYVLTYY